MVVILSVENRSNSPISQITQTQPTLPTNHMGMAGQMVGHSLSLWTYGTALLPKSALFGPAFVTLWWGSGHRLKNARAGPKYGF